MKSIDDKKTFYEECGKILGIAHEYSIPAYRRNRWTARQIGNGRYPGFGLIQCFGSCIRVVSKSGTKIFYSYEDVYEYLRGLC